MSTSLQAMDLLMQAPTEEILERLFSIQDIMLKLPQVPIHTEHLIHAGMYSRTIRMEPGTVMIGSLINRATVLIVQGSATMLAGDERVELEGYNVLAGCPGRKQLFATRGNVEMTMIFPTQAKTVEEAEMEVFSEFDMLMSRRDGSGDTVNITGY